MTLTLALASSPDQAQPRGDRLAATRQRHPAALLVRVRARVTVRARARARASVRVRVRVRVTALRRRDQARPLL